MAQSHLSVSAVEKKPKKKKNNNNNNKKKKSAHAENRTRAARIGNEIANR